MDQATINTTLKAQMRITHLRAAANGLRMHTRTHGGLNRAARRQLVKNHRTAADGYGASLRNYFTSVNLGKIRAKQVAAYAQEQAALIVGGNHAELKNMADKAKA